MKSHPLASLAVAAALLAPASTLAQDSTAAPVPAPPSAPALSPGSLDGSRLAAGAWSYVSTVTRSGATVELGRRTLTVSRAEEGGRPAWLLLDETSGHGQTFRDSLFVARAGLEPIRQHAEAGPMSVRLRFSHDSVTGAIELTGAPTTPVAFEVSSPPVANAGMLESILALAPLDSGWEASIGQLVVSPVGTAVLPITIRVVGEETVTVPAGTFPTWIVEIVTSEVAQRLWVDRATGRLVRARSEAPGMAGVTYETVLVEGR
ncbi:MAG TPA: hypothetical protein VGE02_09485 [Gemmatimonadales bacterium]